MNVAALGRLFGVAVCASLLAAVPASAQSGMPSPKKSPAAQVSQTVGLTDIEVVYHRPGVKGRQVWGGLVPYDQVWRAGANENTVVSFSTDVAVQGRPLAAGSYGLHMIPGLDRWTVAFSRNSTSWGSYSYTPTEDALRVEVTPEPAAEHREWLEFSIQPIDESTGTLELHWEKLRVPMTIQTNMVETTLAAVRDEYLRGTAKWDPQAWQQAAQFCVDHDVNLAEALLWADKAMEMNKTFTTVGLKVEILERLGFHEEAAPLKAEAWTVATESELTQMGSQLMANRQYAEAIPIFRLNVRSHPNSWKAHDLLAEAYRKAGDSESALASYGKALELVDDDASRDRLEQQIDVLKGS